jgi:hypothetical protein
LIGIARHQTLFLLLVAIRNGFRVAPTSTLTVSQVDAYLDRFASITKEADQAEVMQDLIEVLQLNYVSLRSSFYFIFLYLFNTFC